MTLELDPEKLMTSADSRLPAISNEVRVRVEGSKKRLMIVLPRKVGPLRTRRLETSKKTSAVSRMRTASAAAEPFGAEQVLGGPHLGAGGHGAPPG